MSHASSACNALQMHPSISSGGMCELDATNTNKHCGFMPKPMLRGAQILHIAVDRHVKSTAKQARRSCMNSCSYHVQFGA
jgi:hypothetical protein